MDLDSPHDNKIEFQKTVLALKAARLMKGLSRRDAGGLLGWEPVSIEQLENGRCNFSEARVAKVYSAYGLTRDDFEHIRRDPKLFLARTCEARPKDPSLKRKPRRNHYKIVTKEVRVIRILRARKGLSQMQASRLCGYVPGGFGHIEVGRIDLTEDRLRHILNRLGYERRDFDELMKAPILRDELQAETANLLSKLSDEALTSANAIIKALIK